MSDLLRQPWDVIHPEAKLPKGYEWMLPGEHVTKRCKFTRQDSPKWYDVLQWDGKYNPGVHYPMARPKLKYKILQTKRKDKK